GKKNRAALLRQLLWREFYLYIIWKQHINYMKRSITIPVNNKIRWVHNEKQYFAWCEGQTGCPIVDAGMRELNETGYMHNRARLIVGTFLVFYLRIDWRYG